MTYVIEEGQEQVRKLLMPASVMKKHNPCFQILASFLDSQLWIEGEKKILQKEYL